MVYLIHFEQPISPKHTTQHYIGYTRDSVKKRLAEHKANRGARLTQVANERKISYQVTRTWKGGRALEKQLKRRHNAPKLCPICNGE